MAPTSSHSTASRAIKIPVHNGSDGTRYQTSSHRRRSGINRISKAGSSDASESGKEFVVGSDALRSPAAQHEVLRPYQLRETAVASPTGHIQTSQTLTTPEQKDKQRADPTELSPPNHISSHLQTSQSPLGPSMLSSSSYKSVNLNPYSGGDSDEPARLITYTKHSQGFTWNDSLFLPSYLVGRHRSGASRRYRYGGSNELDSDDNGSGDFDEEGERCPVTDIFVTDEEAAAMMP